MQQLVVQRVSSRIFEKNFMISFDIKGIKILQKIHRDFFLAAMFKDDAAWCQWRKHLRVLARALLQYMQAASEPGQSLCIDFMGAVAVNIKG